MPIASSFSSQLAGLEADQHEFSLGSKTYSTTEFALYGTDVVVQSALDVSDIIAIQQRLILLFIFGIFGVTFFGSLLGGVLSRRISRPLVELADIAETFSSGDLATPVKVDAKVREVDLVAKSLERSRVELHQTMVK